MKPRRLQRKRGLNEGSSIVVGIKSEEEATPSLRQTGEGASSFLIEVYRSKRTHTHTQGYYAERLPPQLGNKLKFSFAFTGPPPSSPQFNVEEKHTRCICLCGARRVDSLNIVSGGRDAGLAQN